MLTFNRTGAPCRSEREFLSLSFLSFNSHILLLIHCLLIYRCCQVQRSHPYRRRAQAKWTRSYLRRCSRSLPRSQRESLILQASYWMIGTGLRQFLLHKLANISFSKCENSLTLFFRSLNRPLLSPRSKRFLLLCTRVVENEVTAKISSFVPKQLSNGNSRESHFRSWPRLFSFTSLAITR